MTATVADLVAQLRRVRESLAAAAVTASRAGKDARQAGSHYREAGTGTEHPKLKQAAADVDVAADKAAKVARLLSEAEKHFAAYVARIAPEAAGQDVTITATPTGEQLVQDSRQRVETKKNVSSFLGRATRNAENAKDASKDLSELGEKGIKIFLGRPNPAGGEAATVRPTHPIVQAEVRPKVNAPDAVSQVIIAGLAIGLAANRIDRLIRKGIARIRERER